MHTIPNHVAVFLRILSGYAGMFVVRDIITSSSSHLSKLGYFTAAQYSVFVSCNYACQTISRIGAGLLIDWTNKPRLLYIITCAIAITSIIGNSFVPSNAPVSAILFGLVYVVVKITCSFSRNAMMKILAKYYEHKDFGTVNNILSGVGAVANALSMVLMTALFHRHWQWRYICYLISAIVFTLNIPFFLMKQASQRTQILTAEPNSMEHMILKTKRELERSDTRTGLNTLLRKPQFHILLLLSGCVSILRLSTSFISWYERMRDCKNPLTKNRYLVVLLHKSSCDVPAIGAILFGLSVAAVFAGAGINQLPMRWHNVVTFFTALTSFACITTLYYIHKRDEHPRFILCMILMGINSFMSTPINCLVDGLYAYEISTIYTQSTAMGTIFASRDCGLSHQGFDYKSRWLADYIPVPNDSRGCHDGSAFVVYNYEKWKRSL